MLRGLFRRSMRRNQQLNSLRRRLPRTTTSSVSDKEALESILARDDLSTYFKRVLCRIHPDKKDEDAVIQLEEENISSAREIHEEELMVLLVAGSLSLPEKKKLRDGMESWLERLEAEMRWIDGAMEELDQQTDRAQQMEELSLRIGDIPKALGPLFYHI